MPIIFDLSLNLSYKKGYFNKKSRIDYNMRIIEGDSLTFDDKKKFALGVDNITITDTINNTIIKGNYAEVFKSLDSAMITKQIQETKETQEAKERKERHSWRK